ncbi:hypothetical protein D9M71_241860 [compost metagenome]
MPASHDVAIRQLESQFRDYSPQLLRRPDGSLLLVLRNDLGKQLMSRVIPAEEQSCDVLLNNLVERIRRDLTTLEGPLGQENVDRFLKRIELQTFIPLGQQHRQRKIVVAGAKLRALAGQY